MNQARFLYLILILMGCASSSNQVWVKEGATELQFNQEKTACVELSGTDSTAFGQCMQTRGWQVQTKSTILQPPPASHANPEMKQAFDRLTDEKNKRCAENKFKLFFSKTPCDPQSVTENQMRDTAFVTESERKVILQLQDEMHRSFEQALSIYREQGGAEGERSAGVMESWRIFNDKNLSDLIEGKQTWGDYNRYRKGLYLQLSEELKNINRPR